jgi:hypothetical protein
MKTVQYITIEEETSLDGSSKRGTITGRMSFDGLDGLSFLVRTLPQLERKESQRIVYGKFVGVETCLGLRSFEVDLEPVDEKEFREQYTGNENLIFDNKYFK